MVLLLTDPVAHMITSGDAGGEISEIIAAADRKVGLSARRTVALSVTVGHYRQPETGGMIDCVVQLLAV